MQIERPIPFRVAIAKELTFERGNDIIGDSMEWTGIMLPLADDGFLDFSGLMHCAVYALVRQGKVVYIGQSKSVGERLMTHWRKRKGGVRKSGLYKHRIVVGITFDAVWVRLCMLRELDDLEIAMIKKYQPKHNVKHMPPKPSISLDMLVDMMPLYPLLPPAPERRVSSWRRL